eukprot:TRINITY_DN4084_c0_g1_i1.p1 TRINITY_DN4084_c0_g1~~TRINITY_DN4084_c0_g1_i1.p1  ORF type:complete len:366 (+),score=48.53 TRINITY_DN4084_c0_g1_i1:30-1100(+)
MRLRFWRPSRADAMQKFREVLQGHAAGLRQPGPTGRPSLDLKHLKYLTQSLQPQDLILLRNAFLNKALVDIDPHTRKRHGDIFDYLKFTCFTRSAPFNWDYHLINPSMMEAVGNITVPPYVPPPQEGTPAEGDTVPKLEQSEEQKATLETALQEKNKHTEVQLPEEGIKLTAEDLWEKAFVTLNNAFFGNSLPPVRDLFFQWLPPSSNKISESHPVLTPSGVGFDILLHPECRHSPRLFACVLIHELIHLWDVVSWKPTEPLAPQGQHGVYFSAKATHINAALQHYGLPWKVPFSDDLTFLTAPSPSRESAFRGILHKPHDAPRAPQPVAPPGQALRQRPSRSKVDVDQTQGPLPS